jgi:hypothetical protein
MSRIFTVIFLDMLILYKVNPTHPKVSSYHFKRMGESRIFLLIKDIQHIGVSLHRRVVFQDLPISSQGDKFI